MDNTSSIIITTINKKTTAISTFESLLPDWNIILVGDKKSHPISNTDRLIFLSVEEQKRLGYRINKYLPYHHYVRKNIGYIYALHHKATRIYDTDDDNIPYKYWSFDSMCAQEIETITGSKYHNIYRDYSADKVWPRGFPLEEIIKDNKNSNYQTTIQNIGVWQGLADLDPDVDAIHRLVFNAEVVFSKRPPIALASGVYCPFNSQNTMWHKEMIPYAYLPATVTFRFTDILRGYIAQRCLWEHGKVLGFCNATVYQERNKHNLLSDFQSEIPCYLRIHELVNLLDDLQLKNDYAFNLKTVYTALWKKQFVKEEELQIVDSWIKDIENVI